MLIYTSRYAAVARTNGCCSNAIPTNGNPVFVTISCIFSSPHCIVGATSAGKNYRKIQFGKKAAIKKFFSLQENLRALSLSLKSLVVSLILSLTPSLTLSHTLSLLSPKITTYSNKLARYNFRSFFFFSQPHISKCGGFFR